MLAAGVKRPTDVPARFGGEKFAILWPGTTSKGALDLARSMRDAVMAQCIAHQGRELGNISINASVATLGQAGEASAASLIKAADVGLYGAKAAGRNSIGSDGLVNAPQAQSG